MRQKDLLFHLESALQAIRNIGPTTVSGKSGVRLAGMDDFRSAIETLAEIGAASELVGKIRNSWVFRNMSDQLHADDTTWSQVKFEYTRLIQVLEVLIETLSRNTYGSTDGNSIAIKLPELKDFDDLASIVNDLKRTIAIPISEDEIGGSIRIEGVDNGSVWLYVALGTPVAVSLVGAIAWASAVIYKKWQEALVNREYLRNLKMQNDVYDKVAEAQKNAVDLLILEQVKSIEAEFFLKSDPERLERLKLSVTTLTELAQRGLEIEPALLTPEKASNVFPDFKALPFEPSTTKQLMSESDTI